MGQPVLNALAAGLSSELPMQHSDIAPSTRGRNLAFGSVVAGGGFVLLLLAGALYVVGTMLSADALLLPAAVGMGVGLVWFVVARLARVGHSL